MRTIALTKGYITLIDDEDYQRIMAFGPWMALVTDGKVYAAHYKNKHTYLMHRFILGLTDPDIEADHINRNGLDNQKHNLRRGTYLNNPHNQGINRRNTSGFKGVTWNKRRSKWYAQISTNGLRRHIGSFDTPIEAALAYDTEATKHFGEFACTNAMLNLL